MSTGRDLIVGASSDIAAAVSRRLAAGGRGLYLAGRDVGELELQAKDLEIRHGVPAVAVRLDLLDFASLAAAYDALPHPPDRVFVFVGYLGDQPTAQNDLDETRRIVDTNFTGPVSLLNHVANDFERRGAGHIVGVSSVAGDRGRASNYLYGSAKAGLTAYLSGLRNRLFRSGVAVTTVRPGFVRTRMTEGMALPAALTATPDAAAARIVAAAEARRDSIYVLPVWRLVMTVIRALPEFVFKRTRL